MHKIRWLAMARSVLGASSLFLLLISSVGCAGKIEGRVLDADTGKPIPGAIVLGVWTRVAGIPGMTHHELVGVKEVETDAQGAFVLERPWKLFGFSEDDESITIYKFGYIAWNNLFVYPVSSRREDTKVPARVRLEPFPPGGNHRRHLDFISDATRSTLSHRGERFDEALEHERRMR